ncbi:MAG TPA: hypothetical protein VK726_23625, partial [Acetobacteraceae bacterium]|nr:hypothetical protein [Acetobacteraceae bacterium]
SSKSTLPTAWQLMPLSNKTSAFARCARRCSADPSRANSIKSRRDAGSKQPRRVISRGKAEGVYLDDHSYG